MTKSFDSERSQIESSITKYRRAAWTLIWVGAASALFGAVGKYFYDFNFSEFGDFTGGIVVALWSLAGLFIVYVAFLGQRLQLVLQKEELELNRLELVATREELQGQKKQLEQQNVNLNSQAIQSSFYELLGLYNDIMANSILNYENAQGPEVSGRSCFRHLYYKLREQFAIATQHVEVKTKGYLLYGGTAFAAIYRENNFLLKPFIVTFIQILEFIEANFEREKRKFYYDLIVGLLSEFEMALIFYYSKTGDNNNKELERKLLDSGFFTFFPKDRLLNAEHWPYNIKF